MAERLRGLGAEVAVPTATSGEGKRVIILGVILLVLGFVFNLSILWWIGGILVVVGVIFWILGATGRAVAGRKYWF